MSLVKEFRPTILFLIKFLALYMTLNVLYILFIDHYSPNPDPLTRFVAHQTSWLLDIVGFDTSYANHQYRTSIAISENNQLILSVFEGCNGLNVAIIFISFLLSFGKPSKKLVWFIPVGLLVIHISNLLRIILLFIVAIRLPDFMYFAHKYLFTAVIYVIVFALWYLWVTRLYTHNKAEYA